MAANTLFREFFVTRNIPNSAFAADQGLVLTPYDCELMDVRLRYAAASVSGQIAVTYVRDRALFSAAGQNNLLASPAYIPVSSVLDTNAATVVLGTKIPAGSLILLKSTGDFTSIGDLSITARIRAKVAIRDTGLTELVPAVHIATSAQATNQVVLITPFKCELVLVMARYRQAGISTARMDVVTATTNQPIAAGTSLLKSKMSLWGNNNRNINGLVVATPDNIIPAGRALGLRFSGGVQHLRDLDVTIIVRLTKTKQVSRLY